jgi:hypothetical protein
MYSGLSGQKLSNKLVSEIGRGELDKVRALMAAKADVNFQDKSGFTPL